MKKVIVAILVLSLSLAMVACGGKTEDKKTEGEKTEKNSLGWQKTDDVVYDLSDEAFTGKDDAWKEVTEKVRYVNIENHEFNNIFIEATNLNDKLTKEKFIKKNKKKIKNIEGAKDIEINEVNLGDDGGIEYSYSWEYGEEKGLFLTHNGVGYKVSIGNKDLNVSKDLLQNFKDSISFDKNSIKEPKPNDHNFRDMTFELDKDKWHDVTEKRLYKNKKNTLGVVHAMHNDFNTQQSDDELTNQVVERFTRFSQGEKLKDFKFNETEIAGKRALEFTYTREKDTVGVGFNISYQNMEYIFELHSVDKELAKKQIEAIKKSIKIENPGAKFPLRM